MTRIAINIIVMGALAVCGGCGSRADTPNVEIGPNMAFMPLTKGYGEGTYIYKGAAQVPRQYVIRAASLYSLPVYNFNKEEPEWAAGTFYDLQYLWAVRQLRGTNYPHEVWPASSLDAINEVPRSKVGVNAHQEFDKWYKKSRPTAVLVWHFWFNPNPDVRGVLTEPENVAKLIEVAREYEASVYREEIGGRMRSALPYVNDLGDPINTPQVTWKPDAASTQHGLDTWYDHAFKLHRGIQGWAETCGVTLPTDRRVPDGTTMVDREILPFWNYYVEIRRLDADSAVTALKTYQKLGEIDIIDHTDDKIMSDPALGNVPLENLGYYHHPQNDYVAHGFEVFKDKLGL